jgi:hypothetical protein
VEVALVKANWRERKREREKCAYKENCMNFACSSLHTFERKREREKGKKEEGLCGCKIVGELAF